MGEVGELGGDVVEIVGEEFDVGVLFVELVVDVVVFFFELDGWS